MIINPYKYNERLLEATTLTKSFGPLSAVQQVSFVLQAGQVMALVGASGSGKSTLLSILAGLTDADGGDVRLDGKRVPGPSEVLVAGHAAIRLVHQEYQLMPNVSVRENITYALRFFAKTYRDYRVDELLRLCRLTEVQNRLPRQVSGGEKQRTAIARAIADKPAVLLLDEPFSHLDLPNRLIVRNLLFDLVRHENTACLFVTHDASDALSIAHTVGILRDGKLIQLSNPVDIYRRPETAYAAQMTGPVNILQTEHLPLLGLSAVEYPSALFCLRPEQVRLSEAGISGTVRAVFFKGSHYEIEVELNPDFCLRVLTTNDSLYAGLRVNIQVTADSVWPLQR
ncbi:ABC transporter ATP-binding protein [Spirosoma oryzicola]|uniref:ABC transporter ATP-binding protein n=1 Tax=Spirosoma oryzicola TaxID=2898794 RepID=UPI001E35C35E|nr:ABC transporter ATP-binding protein [Spirosoma oryzicola]UHG89238.1 ABC transporter ATP-binding protein [Spirosoma oryzicola]